MDKIQTLKTSARSLGLIHTRDALDEVIHTAETEQQSYLDFLTYVFDGEILYRQNKARDKRIKEAGFPYPKYLKDFDLSFCKAISKKQFKQLTELTWIDGLYNLILSGPPGVGKTHLAIGLGYQACEDGYKVSYTTMQSLIKVLRTEEIDRLNAEIERLRQQINEKPDTQLALGVDPIYQNDTKAVFKPYLTAAIDALNRLTAFMEQNIGDDNMIFFVEKSEAALTIVGDRIAKLKGV